MLYKAKTLSLVPVNNSDLNVVTINDTTVLYLFDHFTYTVELC